MNEDLDKLYNAVSSQFDIGDLDTFRTRMQTPEDRRKFYDAVSNNGFDLGDYNAYESRLAPQEPIDPNVLSEEQKSKAFEAMTDQMPTSMAIGAKVLKSGYAGILNLLANAKTEEAMQGDEIMFTPSGKPITIPAAPEEQRIRSMEAAVRLANEAAELPKTASELSMEEEIAQIANDTEMNDAQKFAASAVSLLSHPEATGLATVQSLASQAPYLPIAIGAAALTGGSSLMANSFGIALSSATAESQLAIMDGIKEAGYDLSDPDQLKEFIGNKEAIRQAESFAAKRGVAIGAVEGVFGVLGGKIAGSALKKAARTPLQFLTETIGEGTGEASAMLASGEDFDITQVSREMFTGTGKSVADIAINETGATIAEAEKTAFLGNGISRDKARKLIENAQNSMELSMIEVDESDRTISALYEEKQKQLENEQGNNGPTTTEEINDLDEQAESTVQESSGEAGASARETDSITAESRQPSVEPLNEENELQSDVQRSEETGELDGGQPEQDGSINEGSTTDEMQDESDTAEATGDARPIGGTNNTTLEEGRIMSFENEDGTLLSAEEANSKFTELFNEKTQTNQKQSTGRKVEEALSNNWATQALSEVGKVLTSGLRALDKVGQRTTGKGIQKLEDGMKTKLKEWQTSETEALGQVADMTRGIVANATRTEDEQVSRRQFQGQKNMAHEQVYRLNNALQNAFRQDPKSLERVHEVLDPEYFIGSRRVDVESVGEDIIDNSEISFDDLNDKEKEAFYTLRNLNNYTHYLNYQAGLIDQDTYNEFKGNYIHRAYKEFEQRDPSVDEYLGEMFDGKMAGAIYKRRTHDPSTGEQYTIEDPIYLTMKTLSQTMQNVAVKEFSDKVFNDLTKNGLVLTEQEYQESDAKNRYRKLDSNGKFRAYGELTDKYIPNQIAEDFKGFSYNSQVLRATLTALDGYDRHWLRQLYKKGFTTYNPMTRVVNIMGGFWFSFKAGIDHATFLKNRVKAKEDLDAFGDTSQMLMAEGLLSKSAGHVEFKATTESLMKSLESVGIKVDEKKARERSKLIDKLDKWAIESYGRTDDVAKISAYMSMKEMGIPHEEAIDRIAEGFQNYATVGKTWAMSAKTPVFGKAYGRFIADLMRINYNNMKNRPATSLFYIGMTTAMGAMFSELAGEDDDVEEARTRRDFIPKQFGIDETALVWQVPGVGEVNVAKYVTPFYTYDMGEFRSGTLEEATKWVPVQFYAEDGSLVPIPKANDPTLGWVYDLMRDKNFQEKSIKNPDWTPRSEGEQRMNQLMYAVRNGIPVLPTAFAHDLYLAQNGMDDYYGRNRDLSQAILSRIIKVQEFGTPEAVQVLERELDNLDRKIDKHNADIRSRKRTMDKEIKKINSKNISKEKKESLIEGEEKAYMRYKLNREEKIRDLNRMKVEPDQLLKNVDSSYKGTSEGNTFR